MTNPLKASSAILQKAKELGASLVGIARVADLKSAPSFTFAPRMSHAGEGIGTRKTDSGLKPGEVAWPDNARSMVVIAVLHPENEPEMDWWFGRKDPPATGSWQTSAGNCAPGSKNGSASRPCTFPIMWKRAAPISRMPRSCGAGCIGKTISWSRPEFGPRVRLRAVTVDADLFATGPRQFDPCKDCMEFCRRACPQKAFDKRQYTVEDYGQAILPGRDGHYSRPVCNVQMEQDNDTAETQPVDGFEDPVKIIKYCRRCELACPVGNRSKCRTLIEQDPQFRRYSGPERFSGPEYFHVIFSRQMTAMIPGTYVENPFTAKYAVPADQRFF